MRLTASKRLRYLGVSYDPGEELEADGKWADLLQRAKLARVVVEAEHAPRRGRPKGSTNKPKTPTAEQSTGEQSTGEQSTGEQSTGEQSTGEQSTVTDTDTE